MAIFKPKINKPKPKKKTDPAVSLKRKIKIAAAGTIIGASLFAGNITKGAVMDFQKDRLTSSAYGNHLSTVSYPKGKEIQIKSNLKKLNDNSKFGEIYFWDSRSQKINRIVLDPIKVKNISDLLKNKEKYGKIEKILQEAGGQVWEKYFLDKPIGEIYEDLTPKQRERLVEILKEIPTPELQYVQREANMYGTVLGASAGVGAAVKSALILSALLAKIKIKKRNRK